MAFTAGPFNPLSCLLPGKDTWKIKVRVLRQWEMFPIGDSSKPYAINLVLIDSQGVKIEVFIHKNYIPKFRGQFMDGGVYKITYFGVVDNSGAFRASDNEYKIVFNSRTRVVPDFSDSIPTVGLTLKNSAYIEATLGESDFLIDFIGLLTAVSTERQYVKSGKITRKIELDLIDDKGQVRCALFGNYVDIVKEFCSNAGVGLPVVVVQFAKIKAFRGDVVIQNVMNGTQILWDPIIPEVASFRAGLAAQGVDFNVPIGVIDDGVQHVAPDEEFLTMFPRKSINDLHSTAEDGIFIVCGKVSGLFDEEKWWYPSCRCHRAVGVEDGMPFCKVCKTFVLEVIPRFRIKIEVSDGEESATFVLFDADSQHIVQRSCKDLVAGCKTVVEYPDVLKAIVGNEYLFKVEKTIDHGVKYDDSFKVKKICDSSSVIDKFKHNAEVQTPKRLIAEAFGSKFAAGSNDLLVNENVADDSGELSEIGPNTVSLDDISPVECSSVLSSVGIVGGGDATTSMPVKRMRLKKVVVDV